MKISEYGEATKLSDERKLLTDGTDGTKVVPINSLLYKMVDDGLLPWQMRRVFVRHKNLGASVSAAQWEVIKNGAFTDMFIGDYWKIGDKTWRIWDVDYFWNCGDTALTKHHLVIVPDENLGNQKMEKTNTTEHGYSGSEMRTTNLATAKTEIITDFGGEEAGHVLKYRDILTTASASGVPSAYAWTECQIELMNEWAVYGSAAHMSMSTGTSLPQTWTCLKSQFALPQADPTVIVTRYWYWLRDVVSAAGFAVVGGLGDTGPNGASASGGVRPFFLIG